MDNPETQTTLGTRNSMQPNKIKTAQKSKTMSYTYSTKKPGVNTGIREGQSVPVSYKTSVVIFMVNSGIGIFGVTGKTREKIHCHLRNEYFVTVNQFVMMTVEIL